MEDVMARVYEESAIGREKNFEHIFIYYVSIYSYVLKSIYVL